MTHFNLTKVFVLALACLLVCLPLASSFWRLPCNKPITVQRLDPIIVNGSISAHIHTVMGGSQFNSYSDYNSLVKSKCSTCIVTQDNSAYWTPTLWYQHPNGTLEDVPQLGGATIYYLQRAANASEKIYAFPPGFRMVTGNPYKRAGDNTTATQAISYACIDYNDPTAETNAFPQKNCPQGLRSQVFFPSCWDGVNLDSPDHTSHVAYPLNQYNSGICPSSHPVRLISLFFELTWEIDNFASGWLDGNGLPFRALPFIWSFGDNSGFGYHGDFINGWDQATLQSAVDNCNDASGVIQNCPYFAFRSDSDANQCIPEYLPQVNEQVEGLLAVLPNISPIPVSSFDPCGESPSVGYDNTVAGKPLGACKGQYSGKPAYTYANGNMGSNIYKTGPATPAPPPIDPNGYLGCWTDGSPSRTLEKQISGSNFNSTTCRAAVKALNSNYVVFGVQYGGECRASASLTSYQSQGTSTACNMFCNNDPGDWTYCGGPNANQMYMVNY